MTPQACFDRAEGALKAISALVQERLTEPSPEVDQAMRSLQVDLAATAGAWLELWASLPPWAEGARRSDALRELHDAELRWVPVSLFGFELLLDDVPGSHAWSETFWTSLEDLRDQIDEALDRLSDLYDALDEEEALPPTEEQTKEAP